MSTPLTREQAIRVMLYKIKENKQLRAENKHLRTEVKRIAGMIPDRSLWGEREFNIARNVCNEIKALAREVGDE